MHSIYRNIQSQISQKINKTKLTSYSFTLKLIWQKNLITSHKKELLHCILLAKLGKYRKAHEHALYIEKINCLI